MRCRQKWLRQFVCRGMYTRMLSCTATLEGKKIGEIGNSGNNLTLGNFGQYNTPIVSFPSFLNITFQSLQARILYSKIESTI